MRGEILWRGSVEFYANFRWSRKSDDMETVILGARIVINNQLFKDIFGFEFSGDVP